MDEFKSDYDVVAIDMRGYGLSDKPQVGVYACMPCHLECVQCINCAGHVRAESAMVPWWSTGRCSLGDTGLLKGTRHHHNLMILIFQSVQVQI